MFLTGPAVVKEVMGEDVGAFELGGPKVHDRNGVAHFVARTDSDAALLVRDLLDHLPSLRGRRRADVARARTRPATTRATRCRSPSGWSTTSATSSAAPSTAAACWSGARAGRATSCAASRALEGKPVGIIANQPRYLGGVLDSESATKGARFVRTCNAFGIPLLVFVDTPGFMPGTKQEKGGVIRHGAKLVHAFAEASVPKVTLVLRKAFGGAFIAMNSRDLGADYVFAWPQATLGVMGAKQAVGIVKRRDIAAADDPDAARDAFADEYRDEHLTSAVAAAEGYVDEIVPPADTRRRLAEALRTLEAVAQPVERVRNIPL